MFPSRRISLGLTLIAVLSGCQAVTPAIGGGSFQLGVLGPTSSPQPVEVAAAHPPERPASSAGDAPVSPAPTTAPSPPPRSGGGSSGGGSSQPVATGTLTVDLSGVSTALPAIGPWRVLAAVEDIDRLVVTVRIEGQPDQVQEVSAADLQAGTTSITFSALPTGTCTVTIEARDASGGSIGTSSRMAPIAQAEDTDVSVRVLVVPDDGQNYTYLNSFVFGVELQAAPAAQAPDGSGPVSGTVLESYPYSAWSGLYADGAGHFYIRRVYISPQQSHSGLTRFSTTDGSLLQDYTLAASAGGTVLRIAPTDYVYDPVHGVLVTHSRLDSSVILEPGDTSLRLIPESLGSPLAVDAAGDIYYIKDGLLQKAGLAATTATTIPAHSAFAIDSTGNIWVNGADLVAGNTTIRQEVRKFAPDGTLLATMALPIPAVRLLSDGAGGVWVGDRPGGQLVRVQADGTVGLPLGVTATDVCLDAANNLWVAGGPTLLKLAPDGTQLGSYPINSRTITYGDGFIFVGTGGDEQSVLKVVP